ncbi:hypothetical protein OY671_012701, partial [Metschnikowia pulcherrima]
RHRDRDAYNAPAWCPSLGYHGNRGGQRGGPDRVGRDPCWPPFESGRSRLRAVKAAMAVSRSVCARVSASRPLCVIGGGGIRIGGGCGSASAAASSPVAAGAAGSGNHFLRRRTHCGTAVAMPPSSSETMSSPMNCSFTPAAASA